MRTYHSTSKRGAFCRPVHSHVSSSCVWIGRLGSMAPSATSLPSRAASMMLSTSKMPQQTSSVMLRHISCSWSNRCLARVLALQTYHDSADIKLIIWVVPVPRCCWPASSLSCPRSRHLWMESFRPGAHRCDVVLGSSLLSLFWYDLGSCRHIGVAVHSRGGQCDLW